MLQIITNALQLMELAGTAIRAVLGPFLSGIRSDTAEKESRAFTARTPKPSVCESES